MNKIIYLLFLGLMSGNTMAGFYKCTHEGKVIFSDQPCPAGTISESINLPEQESMNSRINNARANRDYEKLTGERRVREIDFEIGTARRKIDENNDKLFRELSELQEKAETLGYVRGNPPDRIKLSRHNYIIARQRRNVIAQQDTQNQIQSTATKYQTENAVLDDRITQLYAEKLKIISTLNEKQLVEDNQNNINDQYQKTAKERRLREIDFEIETTQRKIDENNDKKNREIDALQRKIDSFGDNPLNESGRQSVYISMQAVTLKYQLQNSALNGQIAHLRAEKAHMK